MKAQPDSLAPTITSLEKRPDLADACYQLIASAFPKGVLSPGTEPHPLKEFPLLLSPKNRNNQLIAVQDDRVLATASFKVFSIPTPFSKVDVKISGVGLVVTDPAHRRLGIGSLLQKEVEKLAQEQGAMLSVLWSDQSDYYKKLAYLIAGSELEWTVNASKIHGEMNQGAELRKVKSWSEISHLSAALGAGPKRDLREYESFLGLPKTDVLALFENNKAVAYSAVGKARDLNAVVHEIYGDEKSLRRLLHEHLKSCPEIKVHISKLAAARPALEKILGESELSALAFFKVINHKACGDWMNQSTYLPQGMSVRHSDTSFEIRIGERPVFKSSDAGHLAQLFLGPWPLREFEGLPKPLIDACVHLEPIDLYFWGFDSV